MYRGSNNQYYMELYGQTGTNYTIESATNLLSPVWLTVYSSLSPGANLISLTPSFGATNRTMFFRALQ